MAYPQRAIRPLADRFWEKVARRGPNECWEWLGAKGAKGNYGHLTLGRRGEGIMRAHRLSYELNVGSIPEGMELDHLCRNPTCVNPAHLEPVTHQENLRRAWGGGGRKTLAPCGDRALLAYL